MPTPLRRPALRLALAAAACVGAACAAPPAGGLVETRRDLARALTAGGWTVEPTGLVDAFGAEAVGTAYVVRRRDGDRRRLLVFEPPASDDGADRDALGRDHALLRQRLAGQGAAFYRRPALLVVAFGAGRTALDLRLAQLLGPPTPTADG